MESNDRTGSPTETVAAMLEVVLSHTRDAVLVVSRGTVLRASERAIDLLGGDVRGLDVSAVLDAPAQGRTHGVVARRPGGREVTVDVESTRLAPSAADDDTPHLVFLTDAGARLERETLRVAEELRRRQALEINDTVVQGLVAALLALEQGRASDTESILQRTLVDSRGIMDDLLDPHDGIDLGAGDLTRDQASQQAPLPSSSSTTADAVRPTSAERDRGPTAGPAPRPRPTADRQTDDAVGPHRVLVVDDAEDLRTLLCLRLRSRTSMTVVGQAADGLEAVEQATALQPDLVLLDLAMPRMDGLQALPLIKQAVPGVRVAVLSGFNQATMQQKAIDAGADVYLVKGTSMNALLDTVEDVLAV